MKKYIDYELDCIRPRDGQTIMWTEVFDEVCIKIMKTYWFIVVRRLIKTDSEMAIY